jgi:GDP-L-fucose synthase
MKKTDKILITGAGGMVGAALTERLKAEGYTNICPLLGSDFIDLKGDCSWVVQKERPDYVFHLAAKVGGIGGNMSDQNTAFVENVRINTNVIEACRLGGVKKVVAMGSGAVYSGGHSSENDIWTDKPHKSEYGYAQAKRAMLAHLEICEQQYGMGYAFIVSANLYGPHDKFNTETGHVIPSLIAKFHKAKTTNTPVTIWGTGVAARDFLYVDDMARALLIAAEKVTGPVNVGSGQWKTIADVVDIISRVSGVKDIEWDSMKPNGVHCRTYSLAKIKPFGFEAKVRLEDGIKKTWDWYCENHESARR